MRLPLALCALVMLCGSVAAAEPLRCAYHQAGAKQIYWGDLHVHSGYSLDAWGFGTVATPADAYAFARGKPLALASGAVVQLERPLDFMAVTDHAEWFDLLYLCTDPRWLDDPYCATMVAKNTPATGGQVFAEYVLPTITQADPQMAELCQADPVACDRARAHQWQRVQQQANAANAPCDFTSFVAFEWSATPDNSHNHRNVIFASDAVSAEAIDYLRYPTPHRLWQELARQCRVENGCRALAIPHNTNMGDGKSFDIEMASPAELALRARYERLVEIHQEKGNSECLPAFGSSDEDCGFELFLTRNSRSIAPLEFTEQQWERMRGSYVRRLLLRGLYGYAASGSQALNPLQLGIIGSTDNHAGTGGFVEEDQWLGPIFGIGDLERRMMRRSWNPGGLVAVWAEQNTRQSVFDALAAREVYATSGPRMRVRFMADDEALSCDAGAGPEAVPMGGTLAVPGSSAFFMVQAQYDRTPLGRVEIIKGQYRDGQLTEQVIDVWQSSAGGLDVCATWQDTDVADGAPAFWYARVIEVPTLRWSAHHCRAAGRCDEFPDANATVQERAWTSPIWYLPAGSADEE